MSNFDAVKFVEEHALYTIEDVERIASEAYQQGRADMIDEAIIYLDYTCNESCTAYISLRRILEQVKWQNSNSNSN